MGMMRPPRVHFPHPRVPRLSGLALGRMIPNMVTLLALCAGMTAIRFSIDGKFQIAVLAIIVAGVLDGLDGRIARLLKSTSPLGAQLDSLSDFICFGVAPGIMVYLWTLERFGSVGWVIAVFYAMCCGLRLARFNTQLNAELPSYAQHFFTGVPAPGGAGLAMVPLFFSFAFGDALVRSPAVSAVWLSIVAALMVSRIPTFSMKRLRVPHDYALPILLAVVVVGAFLLTAPWPTLAVVGLIYVASIPLTWHQFNQMRRKAEAAAAEGGAVTAPPEQHAAAEHH